VLNTLEYLWKGGRIGGAKALLGAILRIKPLLDFQGGEVKVLAKLRTGARAINSILEIMRSRVPGNKPIHVGMAHTNALERVLELQKEVQEAFNCAEMDIVELGPVLGTHIGPGFFGLGFYSSEDWQSAQS
jgi:DegV family protein with EDD domain